MLAAAISGKVMKVTRASWASSTSRITTTPTRVSTLENIVTTPSVTSWLSASMSLVMRLISTPGLRRVKKPIDIVCRCEKTRSRRSCRARVPTQPTR